MARPCKNRRICAMPRCRYFSPHPSEAGEGEILMGVDEYECIRLMDFRGLTQAECAAQMQVARTTVQAIYESARRKLAQCLVEGKPLFIFGGSYDLCERRGEACGCPIACPRAEQGKIGRNQKMKKIAVTYENGEVFQHFGHTEQFKVYEVSDGKVTASEVVDTNGNGHGALAGFLKERGVDTLVCGGIGPGAQNALGDAGIRLYAGVTGNADEAVEALLGGTLRFSENATCDHHGHGEGHSCGGHGHGHGEGHGCGGHGHGHGCH